MTALFHAISDYLTPTTRCRVPHEKSPVVIDDSPLTRGFPLVGVDGLEPPTPAL